LMLLNHARTRARFDPDGNVVLLEDQDRTLWDGRLIAEGLSLVDKAVRRREPGAYQVQAAISALHARAASARDTDWPQIERLYATLELIQPSPIVTLNRAVAVSKVEGPEAALALIEPLGEALARYFYFHGLKGGLLMRIGRVKEARESFDRAMALAGTAAEAAHIRSHIDRLTREAAHGN